MGTSPRSLDRLGASLDNKTLERTESWNTDSANEKVRRRPPRSRYRPPHSLPPCTGIARWLAPAKRERRLGELLFGEGAKSDLRFAGGVERLSGTGARRGRRAGKTRAI